MIPKELQRPPLDLVAGCFTSMSDLGWCFSCGDTVTNIEPDARGRICECCGEPMVYGLEECAIMQEVGL